jgi:hypothetical protein
MKKLVKQLIAFLTVTNAITGVSFVSIRGYKNSSGEVANHLINIGATLKGARAKDLIELKKINLKEFILKTFNDINRPDYSLELLQKAYIEVYNSLVPINGKNYDGTTKVQSTRSFAQTDAYEVINPNIKVHKEYNRLYIYGLRVSKVVLVPGTYNSVNSRTKTLVKNRLKKDFKSEKFRNYIVEGADVINFAKTSFKGENLSINLA